MRTMQYQEELKQYFLQHKEEMLSDLAELVGVNSQRTASEEGKPYGFGAAACMDQAAEILSRYGFSTENYSYHVLRTAIGPMPAKLDILAHLDIVPAGDGWTVTTPFEMKEKDGRVYGRGTADDKGPAVCAIYAMRAIRDLDIPLKAGVRLLLGSDEECGGSDLDYYYSIEKPAEMTFTPDSKFPLVNVEKGGLRGGFSVQSPIAEELPRILSISGGEKQNVIPHTAWCVIEGLKKKEVLQILEKASFAGEITVYMEEKDGKLLLCTQGKSAHGSKPELGYNALTALLELIILLPLASCVLHEKIEEISRLFPYSDYNGKAFGIDLEDKKSGKTTLSLTILNYESEERVLCGAFDCRTSLAANEENTLQVIVQKLEKAGFKPENMQMYPPHFVEEDSELVQGLLCAYREVIGDYTPPLAIGGGTYVHNVKNGVAFGCADQSIDNRMHGPDEFMEIEQMLKSCEVFAQAIIRLCGV